MKLPILKPADKPWLWLWGIPVFSMLAIIVASQMSLDVVDAVIVSPFGFSENVPTLFIIVGVAYAIAIMRLPNIGKLKGWMVVYALALVFFAGEDQNWFQYWLGTEVPNYFLVHNKEQETNLHNMSTWFNQKPRLLVEIWVLVACILVPMGWWTWPKKATEKWVPAALWPDKRVVALGIFTLVVGQLRRVFKYLAELGVTLPDMTLSDGHYVMNEAFPGVRLSELEEVGFAYLMALFAALLYGQLVSKSAKKAKPRAKKTK